MPHVAVTYTNDLAKNEILDWDVLGPELHSLIVANSGARPEACRIRFIYPQDDWYIAGHTEATHQAVHVEIALKAGRSAEVKRALSESVLAFLRTHVGSVLEFEVHSLGSKYATSTRTGMRATPSPPGMSPGTPSHTVPR